MYILLLLEYIYSTILQPTVTTLCLGFLVYGDWLSNRSPDFYPIKSRIEKQINLNPQTLYEYSKHVHLGIKSVQEVTKSLPTTTERLHDTKEKMKDAY